MVSATHTSLIVHERSYVAGAKKEIRRLAVNAGFGQHKIDEIDILASEVTSNLVKHAKQGEILAGIVTDRQGTMLELIAIDNGPGISDPERMMQDGISTKGTLGHGLGAIRRLSDDFGIYSMREWGTVLLSRSYRDKGSEDVPRRPVLTVRSLIVAKPGEMVSGDGSYGFIAADGKYRLMVADGLGHGFEANRAVAEAVMAFRDYASDSPVDILRYLHATIRKTRGMVAAVVVIDPVGKMWKFCGIGNITTRFSGVHQARSYLSYNGIVGHNIPVSLIDQEVSQQDFQQITFCSDGIRSRWQQMRLPDLGRQDLAIQAGAIYKDFARRNDDMSIIIGKLPI
ncbi:MAG TPA: ATP-binding protein [Puia sp.]|jgi:anti-sigma regulatory factor (Ser/Thr protein kinase)|nr:ATP-binding protein [Puia sp.]